MIVAVLRGHGLRQIPGGLVGRDRPSGPDPRTYIGQTARDCQFLPRKKSRFLGSPPGPFPAQESPYAKEDPCKKGDLEEGAMNDLLSALGTLLTWLGDGAVAFAARWFRGLRR